MIRKTTPERLSFFVRRDIRRPYHGAGLGTASTGATYLRSSAGAVADMVKLRGQLPATGARFYPTHGQTQNRNPSELEARRRYHHFGSGLRRRSQRALSRGVEGS